MSNTETTARYAKDLKPGDVITISVADDMRGIRGRFLCIVEGIYDMGAGVIELTLSDAFTVDTAFHGLKRQVNADDIYCPRRKVEVAR